MKHILLIALLFAIYFLCAFSCNAQRRPRWHHSNDSVKIITSPKGLDNITVTYSGNPLPINPGSYVIHDNTIYSSPLFIPKEEKTDHRWMYWIPLAIFLFLAVYLFRKATKDEVIYWPEDHNDSEDDSGYPNPFGINNNLSKQ